MTNFRRIAVLVLLLACPGGCPRHAPAQPYYGQTGPRAGIASAGTAPSASIAPVVGQWLVYDVRASSAPGKYLTLPRNAATIIDGKNGFIFVQATAKCVLIQVVSDGTNFDAAAIDVDPGVTPIGPTPIDPAPAPPAPQPVPVTPPPAPVNPPPPNSGDLSIVVVHDPKLDSKAVLDGLGSPQGIAFWASLRSAGRGTYTTFPGDAYITSIADPIAKSGGLPCVLIFDNQSKAFLAGKKYTGDNADVSALIDSLPKPSTSPAYGRYQ